ncbi:MAG TPA: hypothetical protein VI382_04285 [Candidatus Manganitrophaceae bacterium]|nr:hypothetical protein [Candidatus Manganitrophaceae bacterium]
MKAIAKIFEIGYTGVSRRVIAVTKRIEEGKRLRETVENILDNDAKVKT